MFAPKPDDVNAEVHARNEKLAFAAIMDKVKAEFRSLGRRVNGAEIIYETRKRWADHCGVPFNLPTPIPATGPPTNPIPRRAGGGRGGVAESMPHTVPEPTPVPMAKPERAKRGAYAKGL